MPRFGFIHTKEDIKFLVLYCMGLLTDPVTFDTVVDLCTACDDGFGWFDLKVAFDEMVASGHIDTVEGLFQVTTKGTEAATLFDNRLPHTVKEAARKSALRITGVLRRNAVVTTHTERTASGDYAVTMTLEDVYTVQLYAPSAEAAARMEQQFKRNAEEMYPKVLEIFEG